MDLGIRKAFILAGGEGTRLRPLTFELQKALIPVKGKPVLQWNLELCKKFGVKEVILALGYKHGQIEDFFGKGEKLGLKIDYSVEKEFLGTAGALKFAEHYFKGEEKFIMMNGDECKEVDFAALDKVFEKNHAIVALALKEMGDATGFGLVKRDGEKIICFDEKPEEPTPGEISAGAYILSSKIFGFIPSGKNVSIERDTFPKLIAEKKAFAAECVPEFFATDTFERWEKAIFGWKGLLT